MPPPRTLIVASHPAYYSLLAPQLKDNGVLLTRRFDHGVARVLLDYPLTWALTELGDLNSFERSHTLVCTQASHAAYHDCIASFHVAAVANIFDEHAVMAGVHAAAHAQKHYAYRAGLTYMELRVTRLLLLARRKDELAGQLGISSKTVNAHISNILTKLGLESRSQYVARLLGGLGERPEHA